MFLPNQRMFIKQLQVGAAMLIIYLELMIFLLKLMQNKQYNSKN